MRRARCVGLFPRILICKRLDCVFVFVSRLLVGIRVRAPCSVTPYSPPPEKTSGERNRDTNEQDGGGVGGRGGSG